MVAYTYLYIYTHTHTQCVNSRIISIYTAIGCFIHKKKSMWLVYLALLMLTAMSHLKKIVVYISPDNENFDVKVKRVENKSGF